MGRALDDFVREENLKLYRRLLLEAHDEERRRVLLQLIAGLTRPERSDQRPT
ncbi:hypothetical protein RPB_3746 [Rhodopseudomonas palustris HaA2]|uniref:Uncharacterized protein n=1 Tax=Rhodopseudomonas palustris (strain HaA2) TaxID=316058 RepID=Q2ITM0_RHOP2|nr:hypothetical protein RPB_3746 [Rhodopseudomonas palustris HaA2]